VEEPQLNESGRPSGRALRDDLEARALAGATWLELVALLSARTGVSVRLAAADGALLGGAEPDGATQAVDHLHFDAPRIRILDAAAVRTAFARSEPVVLTCTDGRVMLGRSVAAGERRVGVLLIDRAATDAEAVLDAGRTAVAVVAVRQDVQAAAVAETAGWFVDELRFGSRRSPAELAVMGTRFGVRLTEPLAAAVIHYDGPDTRMFGTALSWLETPVSTDGAYAFTVVGSDAPARVRHIRRRLQEIVRAGTVLVAAGPVVLGAEALLASFEKAGFALRVLRARESSAAESDGAVTVAELGLLGLLADVPATELTAYVQARLGPLLGRAELLRTLAAWYATGGSRLNVAAAVQIHRNSVGHRMDRLRTLLGVDPADPAVALELQTALAAIQVLDALAER
jgi:hypothetical protein